jgi:lysophospholipase L1-like esterase
MKKLLFVGIIALVAATPYQDPNRFRKEIDSLVALNKSASRENLILFTGSSSIRMWKDLKTAYPKHNVMNMGFGGSDMSELLYYADEIIVPFAPKQLFIYEGDNDIAKGKTPDQILASADSLVGLIKQKLPDMEIVFISAKPSVRRWELKNEYIAFNKALKEWASKQKNVRYADVWTPMVKRNGEVMADLFIEDNLHMNKKGYQIWRKALKKFLR